MDRKYYKYSLIIAAVFLLGYLGYRWSTTAPPEPVGSPQETIQTSTEIQKPIFHPDSSFHEEGSRKKIEHPDKRQVPLQQDAIEGPSELERKYQNLSPKEIVNLLASDLTAVERDYLEHLLAESRTDSVDEMLGEMLDDGFLDLSLTEDDIPANEAAGFMEAATQRMNSAIRVTGLRGMTSKADNIIDIASHTSADESTVRACYEALGYLGTSEGTAYLSAQLQSQENLFLKSEIVLSLSTSGSSENIDLYLSYLNSPHIDLRNSAIVALGEAKDERAVEPFSKMFESTHDSSKVLIVQALTKIDSADARSLLEEISEKYPRFVPSASSSREE